MRDGSDYYENFGGGIARGGWRSNRSGIRGPRQTHRFAQWRSPFDWYARGVRPPFVAACRPPLLPTPWPAFRIPRPPNFADVQCNRWQSPAPGRYLSTYCQYGASASQPRDRCIGECDDANVTHCDVSPSLSKPGRQETSREHRTPIPTSRPRDGPPEVFEARVVADPRRRRSPKRYYDSDRLCDDPNASGASDALRDCREPSKRSSSPATSEHQPPTTSPFTPHSPSTSRSRDWSEDTSGVRKTSRDSNERRSPSSRWRSCSTPPNRGTATIGLATIESGSSGDSELAKRRRDRSTSCDPGKNSKRHKPGCRAGKFRSRSEEKSSSASSQVPPPRHIKRSAEMMSDSAKRKARASGVVKPESSRTSVANASTRTKPQRRDHPLKRAFISFISPEIAKYRIPKLSMKEQPSSAQVKGPPDVPSVRKQQTSCSSATKKLLAALCATSELRTEPGGDVSPQSSEAVAESPRSLDSIESGSTDLNPESPEPALLVVEEERVYSSPDPDVVAPSVAVADSTTSPNSGKAVSEDDRCDVASDVTERGDDDGTDDLSPGPPSPEAHQVTTPEQSPSPTVAAFEEVGEDQSCDDASDGTERQCAYDAEISAGGPRPVTDAGADEVSNMSPTESVCPETTLRSPSDKEGAAVGAPLERPLVCGCDLHIESGQSAELCQDDTLSDTTEVYEYDQPSSSSEVTLQSEDGVIEVEPSRSRSVSSGSATELSDFLIVSEEDSEEDASPDDAAVNSSVSEAPVRGDESTRVTPQATLLATSTPPTTDAGRLRTFDSLTTSNRERVTISSGVSASAAGVNADEPELDRPDPENARRCETVAARAHPVSDAGTSSTNSRAPAKVSARTVAEEVVSEDLPSPTASLERPALVHCAVRMPPEMPPLRVPMYEVKTAQSSEATGVCRRFPVVDGPDGRRGALFELMTITSLYVLNVIEDYSTRDLVIQLYLEGRHSDSMEAYGERIRTLVQAAVERQSESWKDLIGVLRRLATIEWLFPQPGSCAGARIRELCELENSHSQL